MKTVKLYVEKRRRRNRNHSNYHFKHIYKKNAAKGASYLVPLKNPQK